MLAENAGHYYLVFVAPWVNPLEQRVGALQDSCRPIVYGRASFVEGLRE